MDGLEPIHEAQERDRKDPFLQPIVPLEPNPDHHRTDDSPAKELTTGRSVRERARARPRSAQKRRESAARGRADSNDRWLQRAALQRSTAQCEEYRESLSAATPCLRSALAGAIVTALEPLAREQQVRRAAELAAKEVASQIAKDAAAKSTAGGASAAEVTKLRLELAQLKRACEQTDAGELAPYMIT